MKMLHKNSSIGIKKAESEYNFIRIHKVDTLYADPYKRHVNSSIRIAKLFKICHDKQQNISSSCIF